MLTNDKITEIFCIADDFCKEFAQEFKKFKMLPEDGKKHRKQTVFRKNIIGTKTLCSIATKRLYDSCLGNSFLK